MQQRLDANIQLLDSQAGALISRHLQNEEQDLTNNLRIIQQSMSLRYPRCESMVTLLNFFGQPRDEVLSNLFEHLKANFDELLRSMVDVEIARLLDSSKALLTSPSLRFIPIALIKQLKRKLPDEVMDMVIQEQLQQEFNNDIKTQVREYSQDFFISELGLDDEKLQVSDAVADSVVKRLGKSNRLLHIFAEHCSKKFEDTLDQRWVEIFRRVCFKFQENGGEIGQLGQFFTFLRKLFREPLDLKDLKELYNALRKVIVSQTNLDERSFDEEQRDYYLRHPVSEAVQEMLNMALDALEKLDRNQLFLNPVNESIAPGYFSRISRPVDISMMKRRLFNRRYSSIQELHADIQLMVQNSIQYNGEDSDIGQYGQLILKDWTNRWIHGLSNKPSSSFRKLKASSVTTARTPVRKQEKRKFEEVEISPIEKAPIVNKQLKRLLREACSLLRSLDTEKIFEYEVTDDVAPGYSDEIENPICILDMVGKVQNGEYESMEELEADVKLMFNNCVQFNGEDSDLGEYAMKLDKKWNKRKTELFTSKGTDQNLTVKVADPLPKKLKVVVDKSADPAPSTAAFDVDNYLDHQDLVNCFEIVSNLDAWDVFKEKVDIAGYEKIVTKPMYLSIISNKINAKDSSYTFSKFDADVELIFDNCKLFNGSDDVFGKYAKCLQVTWRKIKQIYAVLRSKDWEEKILQIPFLKNSTTAIKKIISLKDLDRLLGANADNLNRVLGVTAQYLTEVDQKKTFLEPVNSKEYRAKIKSPMDISTIKRNAKQGFYRSIDDFHEDVALIARNCLYFNSIGSYGDEALSFYTKWTVALLILEIKFPFFFKRFQEKRSTRFYDENSSNSATNEIAKSNTQSFELTDAGSIKLTRKAGNGAVPNTPKTVEESKAQETPIAPIALITPIDPTAISSKQSEAKAELENPLCVEQEQAMKGTFHDGTAIKLPYILTMATLTKQAESKSLKKCLKLLLKYLLALDSDRRVLKVTDSDKIDIKIDRGLYRTIQKAEAEFHQIFNQKYASCDLELKKVVQQLQYGCYLSCGNIASFLDGKEEEIYLDEDHTDLALRASASAEEDSQTVKSEAKYEANKMEVVETEINVKVEESRKASDPTLILATVNVETNPDSEKIESSQPIMKVETKVEATETSALSEVPQPSERLRSYRLVKHQLRENVQPIPQLSTFATLKFIVLLLKEKKVQDRFLAAANKAIQEKVATAVGSSNNVELAQLLNDANFRFCLQIIQICFTSSLELPAFNEKMWEVYLPALVLQHKLLKLEELQCIPSDTMANAYLEKYPLSSQDGIQLDLWKEKLKRWIEDLRRSK